MSQREVFWKGAASFVQISTKTPHRRTNKQFYEVSDVIVFPHNILTHCGQCMSVQSFEGKNFQCPTDAEAYYLGGSASAHKDGVDNLFSSLSRSFSQCCARFGIEVSNDFIEFAVKAMVHLKKKQSLQCGP